MSEIIKSPNEEVSIQYPIQSNTPNNENNNIPINDSNFTKLKDEILAIISEKEASLSAKISECKQLITESHSSFQKSLTNINTQYNEIISSSAGINNRLERLNNYESFFNKTNDQLITHEIRITNISKDLAKSTQKYDKIFIDNLLLPGYIGEYCKYKTTRDFHNDILTQIGTLNTFKEKQTLDLKAYKERLESLIKIFNLQVENNTKANMKYTTEQCERRERNFNEKFEELNDRIITLRMDNSKYVSELISKSKDLTKEWEIMKNLKEDVFRRFDEKVAEMKKADERTVHSFEEMKSEFMRIKRKFTELAEFIKDVRFRKNLGGDVKKSEIKTIVRKMDFKRKNSLDDKKNNNKGLKRSDHKKKTQSINLRQSHSQDVERKFNGHKLTQNNFNEEDNHKVDNIKAVLNDSSNDLEDAVKREKKEESVNSFITNENMNFTNYTGSMINNNSNSNLNSNNNSNSNLNSNNNNSSNNNNNNRYTNDVFFNTNDKIIHELASELEQSGNKLDRIKIGVGLNNEVNTQNDNEDEKENQEKNPSLSNNIINTNNKSNNTITDDDKKLNLFHSNSSNYMNILDVKKGQKELDKKIYLFQKKVVDLEIYTKQKIIELSNQIDLIISNKEIPSSKLTAKDYELLNHTYHPSNSNNNNNKTVTPSSTVAIIEVGGTHHHHFNGNNQQNSGNNSFMGNSNVQLNSIKPKRLASNSNRVKTGKPTSKLDKMIVQALGNAMKDDITSKIFIPEYKVIKKVDKKAIINCDIKGSPQQTNTGGTHYIPLQKIMTNQISPENQISDSLNLLNNKDNLHL